MREIIESVSQAGFSIVCISLMSYVLLWQQPRHSRITSSFVYNIIFQLLGNANHDFVLRRHFVPSIEFVELMNKLVCSIDNRSFATGDGMEIAREDEDKPFVVEVIRTLELNLQGRNSVAMRNH